MARSSKAGPLLLSFDDGTNTVPLGQLKHSGGVLAGRNQVVYPDAFDGVKADLVYTYRKGGFEQDVVLRERPPYVGEPGFEAERATASADGIHRLARANTEGWGAKDKRDNLQDYCADVRENDDDSRPGVRGGSGE